MDISEFELIRRIVKQIPKSLQEPALLRDDTAVLINSSGNFRRLLTTDVIVDKVDFRLHKDLAEHIGRKALGVNLSDIAAMGGTPECFTVALGIPPAIVDAAWVKRFYHGLLFWARRFKVVCAGGDISKSATFFASVTVLGKSGRRPILRCDARAGDWIGVTGALGGSLKSGHHFLFKPRIEEGRFLADNSIHAMIDISDGLAQDLTHILNQSQRGCEIETTAIPITPAVLKRYRTQADEALRAALTDGEDFELLFTASTAVRRKIDQLWKKRFPMTRLSWIGRITSADKQWTWTKNGEPCNPAVLNYKGYQHF